MLESYAEFNLVKEARLYTNNYYLSSSDNRIGTIQEGEDSSRDLGNHLAKFFQFFGLAKLDFMLLDAEGNLVGRITKDRGLDKDISLFSEQDEYIATMKPAVNTSSPAITVVDTDGNDHIKAEGNFGSTDFSVFDCRKDIQIAYLKKRAFEEEKGSEKQGNHGEYYNITNNKQERSVTIILIAMCVVLDLYSDN